MDKPSQSKAVVKFGSAVRKIRLAKKLTQLQLAEEIGIDIAHLSRIERGQKDISLATAAKIAQAIGLRLYLGEHRLV